MQSQAALVRATGGVPHGGSHSTVIAKAAQEGVHTARATLELGLVGDERYERGQEDECQTGRPDGPYEALWISHLLGSQRPSRLDTTQCTASLSAFSRGSSLMR